MKPHRDPFDLIRKYLADWNPDVIFDVGANVGQSATVYASRFPEARVHSFEPSPETYRHLVEAMAQFPQVTTHNIALGRSEARSRLTQSRQSALNHLVPPTQDATEGTVEVQVRSGIEVMRGLGVERIDYLKIDTEGHDLEVLHGFLPELDRVDFIQVEAGMNPYNTTHVPFGSLDGLLQGAGFHLFHIFEQKMEWKRGGRPVLRRSNPVYINRRLVDLRGVR
jgi:FkbM family methyltransferase